MDASSPRLARTQREAVDALKRELFGNDPVARSRYVRAFHEEFNDFRRPSSYDDLLVAGFRSDVILLGDYHAYPESQLFAARFLEDLARRSHRTLLAVEMVFARQQPALDAWMAGRASDAELRARIRYDLDWGYAWDGPKQLLDTARRLGVRTFGVDGPRRGGTGTLRRRDTMAAERLAELAVGYPDAKLVVLFGESHLAREHLPARLRTALLRRDQERRVLRVLQNVDEIYWRLLERGLEHREVVEVEERTYAVFNGTPLRKYEAYRRTVERWSREPEDDELDLTPTVHAMIEMILGYLGFDPSRRKAYRRGPLLVDLYPEVYGRPELTLAGRILEEAGLERGERARILRRVRGRGSCYVPAANLVLLGRHRLVDAGEEASHFAHQALARGVGRPRPAMRQHDLFYREVMEEALGYFGSKIIDPSRNLFFEDPVYRDRGRRSEKAGQGDADRVLAFVLEHRRLERRHADMDTVPELVLRAIHGRDPLYSSYAHHLGYFLGERLFAAHRAGAVERSELVTLFREPFERSGRALRTYLDLVPRLDAVLPA